jgi:hypothetical protein
MANRFEKYVEQPATAEAEPNRFAKYKPQPMSGVEDVARSLATGVGEGAAGTVGLLGDVQTLGDAVGTWVGDRLGLPRLTPEQEQTLRPIRPPTTADVERATGFDQMKHQPQTTAGEYARTVGQFVPGAATMGAGTVAGTGRAALRYGIVPGLAAETAGQYTEGTPMEPLARTGAAILASGPIPGLGTPVPAAVRAAPTRQAMRSDASALFQRADQMGIVYDPTWYAQTVDAITRRARTQGVRTARNPRAADILAELNEMKGTAPTMTQILDIRSAAAELARKSADEGERHAAGVVLSEIEDALGSAGMSNIISKGDPQEAFRIVKEANALWRRQSVAAVIEEIAKKAGRRDVTKRGAALKQGFRTLADNPNRMRAFTPDERKAIEEVAQGGPLTLLSSLTQGVWGVGPTLRAAANLGAKPKAKFADALVRSGGRGVRMSPYGPMIGLAPVYAQQSGAIDEVTRALMGQ